MTVEAIFLSSAADGLVQHLSRIESCLERLPPEFLWARGSEQENAVGNLLLHLEGNVRQWILSGIGGAPDNRDRASEFAARSGAGAPDLVRNLRGTVMEAVDLLRSLPHSRLTEQLIVQGYKTTMLGAVFHVAEHFAGHTYQIIFATKQATGEDLGFYGYLSRTGRKEFNDNE